MSDNHIMKVALDSEAPDFVQRKSELKASGYRWDSDEGAWISPQLSQSADNNQAIKPNQDFCAEGYAELYDLRSIIFRDRSMKPLLRLRTVIYQDGVEKPLFVDLKVTGKKAKKILKSLEKEINDRERKVSGRIKFCELNHVKTDGQAFLTARLKSICSIDLDGRRLNLKRGGEPELVYIDSQSPDFVEMKSYLKERGFRWNRDRRAWERRAFLKDSV